MKRIGQCASAPWLGLIGLLTATLAAPHADAQTASRNSKDHPSVVSYATSRSAPVFVENRGQFDSRVRFQVKVSGKVLWLTNNGIVFDLRKPRSGPAADALPSAIRDAAHRGRRTLANEPVERLVFAENFVDSNEHPAIEVKGARAGAYNYLTGTDPANWHTDIHGYSELLYRDVWPGIDVRISANGPDLEQEFIVHPGGDPRRIKVGYDGIEKLKVASDGSLAVQTAFGILRESKPRIYQQLPGKTVAVKGRFALSGGSTYTFAMDSYRPEYALVIDPTVLLYSTYLGGSGNDQGWAIAADSAGNAYAAGYTSSPNFPTTAGAYSITGPANFESFITKLGPTGIPVYSTFYNCGGCAGMFIRGIAVDSAGEAVVTGLGNGDAVIVAKLNSGGNALLYEISVGAGTSNAIALDSSGNAYVAGGSSGGLTTTPNAYQQSPAGNPLGLCCIYGADAFVAVVNPQGSLLYSTYFGGFYSDGATAIAVDAYGAVYVGGITYGPTLPTTPGAFQATFPVPSYCYQCASGWVAKLNPSIAGTAGLIYASYLGGTGNSYVYGIAVDSSGSAYAAGVPASAFFPFTPGAFSAPNSCGGGFVTKFNPGGSGLVYSTCLGSGVSLQAIALDTLGEAYVVGYAGVVPVTPDAFQPVAKSQNAFLVKLNAAGSGVIYGSYLGGSIADVAHAVAVDPTGDAYITGDTDSPDFPVTQGAFQLTSGGGDDAFVTKFPLGSTLRVLNVTPTSCGNAGSCTLSIQGSGLHDGAIVTLVGPSQVSGGPITVGQEGLTGATTFNLTSASPGAYSVAVTNPDGTNASLSQGFTVQQGGAPEVWADIVGEGVILAGKNQLYYVEVGNHGNVDAAVTRVWTAFPNYIAWQAVGQSPSSSGQQNGTSYVAFDVAPTAGSTVEIPINLTAPGGSYVGQTFHVQVWMQTSSQVVPQANYCLNCNKNLYSLDLSYSAPTIDLAVGGSITITAQFIYPVSCPLCPKIIDPDAISWVVANPSVASASGGNCNNTCTVQGVSPGTTTLTVNASNSLWGISGQQTRTIIVTTKPPICTDPAGLVAETCGGGCILSFGVAGTAPQIDPSCDPVTGPPVGIDDSGDPNGKAGSPGVGNPRYVSGSQRPGYSINFANEATASAAAQTVQITDPLNTNVIDVNTVVLGPINFGTNVVTPLSVPLSSFGMYTAAVDLRPGRNLIVGISAALNSANGILTWTFTSLDPATNQPTTNPLAGFLPPGNAGSVSFTALPVQGVATGTVLSNQATVVFDANPPMSTPVWINTIDNTPPVSVVSALAATQTTSCFRPQWTAKDAGSGVQGTTIFVSDNGGAYTPWLTNTTSASAIYTGVAGHTYAFYSQATDLVGNVEATKSSPDASTSVPAGASCNGRPTVAGSVAGNSLSGTTETLTLQLTNNGVGNAQNIKITSVSLRTLVGTGSVTLSSPATPISVGSLAAGASVTETLTLNAPATVKEFSITEAGTVQDLAGNTYSFSIAEAVIP